MTESRPVPAGFLGKRWVRHREDGFVYELLPDMRIDDPDIPLELIDEMTAFEVMGFTPPKKATRRKTAIPQVDLGAIPENADPAE